MTRKPLDRQGRADMIATCVGDDPAECTSCGDIVTPDTLHAWNDDGDLFCTKHGPLAEEYEDEPA